MLAVFMYDKLHLVIIGACASLGVAVPFPTMAQEFLIVVLVFVPLTMGIELFRGKPGALANISTTLVGALYVAFSLGAFIGIRELFVPADFPVYAHFHVTGAAVPDDVRATIYRWGGYTVLSIFVTIWVCDSGAYFAGRAFGRHKLFPRVSPKKTWEGAVAGFVAALLMFVVLRGLLLPYLSLRDALVCGGVIGVFGQVGDLAESLLKRDAGVKDSSTIIPGHGGVLDRFDSLLFVAPLLFVYLDFIVF
jgi:phosphatidate cytidylyltransferase